MNNVPYLYVNLIALVCYVLIFLTFLASKKTPTIRAFIIMMLGFILWIGGSILMRLQVFPGLEFWYYVSIMALFSIAVLMYNFVRTLAHIRGRFLLVFWSVCTALLLIATSTGRILAPPTPTATENGTVFLYDMHWPVVIPYVVLGLIIISIIKLFRNMIMKKGIHAPGIKSILAGCVIVALGNLLQLLPGNSFPWDTLSSILFAVLLVWAMYKKHMFRLTLIASRTLLLFLCGAICFLAASYFVSPTIRFLSGAYPLSQSLATTITAVFLALFLCGVYIFLRKIMDVLFIHDQQKGKMLQRFSAVVSQSLDTAEIMDSLTNIIQAEIAVNAVYVCLREGDSYVLKHSAQPLSSPELSIRADSPCIRAMIEEEECLILSEFQHNPLYLSVWAEEKALLRKYSISVMAALKDGSDVVGLVLLGPREKGASLTYTQLSLINTVTNIASIAIKNAGLYERMYREARTDSLTGVYNYHYFVEKMDSLFKEYGNEGLALLYLDLDDFKLYNQLYGTTEGDQALRKAADIITRCVGDTGITFRNSGKVFAVLLPRYDGPQTELLAKEIQRRIGNLNAAPERSYMKELTVSCGVCISPYAASSAKELMENADLAVYNAKSAGKNCICFFKGMEPVAHSISERAHAIVEASRQSNVFQANASTIHALTAAIDAKDHYTYKHSQNVAMYAAILATAAGLNEDQISMIYYAGLLHDIGKISIPESILDKNGKLTDEEYEIIKGHVNSAIDMIRYLPSMDYVIPAAIGHHERWDGRGYPKGAKGEEIPLSARCLAVADAFDAMTTKRPYKSAFTAEYAAQQIEKGAGTQFDPQLSELFVSLVRTGQIKLEG